MMIHKFTQVMRRKLASRVRKTPRDIMNCMRLQAIYVAMTFSTAILSQKLAMDSLEMLSAEDQNLWSEFKSLET